MPASKLKLVGRNSAGTSFLLLLAAVALACIEAVPVADRNALEAMRDQCRSLSRTGLSSTPGDACDLFSNADTSLITDMSYLFDFDWFFNPDISRWDTSNVTDMTRMFWDMAFFNGDLSRWDTSRVTSMSEMFELASSFTGDISKWDVSAVNTMEGMFSMSVFNGNISNWDVSAVNNMAAMFEGSSFNGNITNWDVSAVNDMSSMFRSSVFTGDISKWDVSAVNDMSEMFSWSSFNGNIANWDVSAVKDMSQMFAYSSFTGDISKWDVSAVNDMSGMFWASSFNADLSLWDISDVTDMSSMFWDAIAFHRSLCAWSNSTADMANMFGGTSPKTGLCCSSGTYADGNMCCVPCPAQATCAGEPALPQCAGGYMLQANGDRVVCVASSGCIAQFSPEDANSMACVKEPYRSANCQEDRTWEQLYSAYEEKGANPALVAGGLGSLMKRDKFEVWVCLRDHLCLNEAGVNPAPGDLMCFVYDEDARRFIAWDKQSKLNLF